MNLSYDVELEPGLCNIIYTIEVFQKTNVSTTLYCSVVFFQDNVVLNVNLERSTVLICLRSWLGVTMRHQMT